MDGHSRELATYYYENKHLPKTLLSQLQEKKAKIRKFMLYVDGVLSDTEKDMQTLCQLFMELENLFNKTPPAADCCCEKNKQSSPDKRRRKVKFKSTNITIGREKPVVPETVPIPSTVASPNEQSVMVVPETCAVEDDSLSQHSSQDACTDNDGMLGDEDGSSDGENLVGKGDVSVIDSYMDETVGVLRAELTQPSDQPQSVLSSKKSLLSKLPLDEKSQRRISNEFSTDDSDEHGELPILTPVTSLLKTVMGGVKKPAEDVISSQSDVAEMIDSGDDKSQPKEIYIADGVMSANVLRMVSDDSAAEENAAINSKPLMLGDGDSVNASYSPALFADNGGSDNNDEDETYFDNGVREMASTSKNKKAVVSWPIGYSKSNKGQLVVEPSTACAKSSKRARQTRLDGFLAKATLQNSMDSSRFKPVISMKRLGSKKGSKARHIAEPVSLDSDSDSNCEIDLELLQPRDSNKPSARKHSPRKPQRKSSNLLPDFAAGNVQQPIPERSDRKRKYEIGEVVRGKARKHLTGYRCLQCYEYYRTLNLTEGEIQQRLNEVCRHRAVKPPMETPPTFWNMSIASLDDTS